MADDLPAAFVMHGAREVVRAGALHLEQQIAAIEGAVSTNPGLAFDISKTLLESACKTVLSERMCGYDQGWELPRLLKETLSQLRLAPMGLEAEREVTRSMHKMAGGLQTVVQGICELRNSHGFASHGKDASFQQLESVQALLVARSVDTIVNFLFQVHRAYHSGQVARPLAYDENPAFNESVDSTFRLIQIFESEFKPSEVLFQMEPETYRVYLAEFEPQDGAGSTEPSPSATEEEGP